jgi:hypothetical protein
MARGVACTGPALGEGMYIREVMAYCRESFSLYRYRPQLPQLT